MQKCAIKGCNKFTRYRNSKTICCPMHQARIRRHGHPGLKTGSHGLEKLPHHIVDDFITKNWQNMEDRDIVRKLKRMGFRGATWWTIRYRRRKLGLRKYLSGEIKKHKAWIRAQAIKMHGTKCELCTYQLVIDTHHLAPKKKGGKHSVDNLIVLCPNCHALITRNLVTLNSREEIPKLREKVRNLLNNSQPYFG